MSQYVRILTNKHNTVLEHHQSIKIDKILKSKHAQNRINPFSHKIGLSLIPISHLSYLLLIYQAKFIFLIKIQLLYL